MTTRSELNVMLEALLGDPSLVSVWWGSPNKSFYNKTPDEMYSINKELVEDYIHMFFIL